MYKAFYHLQRDPFEITPDPSFLFATRAHNEALAALYYGVRKHKGFVVMTGEVGTGKTLVLRCLLELLSRNQVAFAYIFNPRLSALEFIRYVVGDFGLVTSGKTKDELLLGFWAYLTARHKEKLTTLLVVDEAHHLSEDVLEEVRLLTNLETPQQKLLQIVLVGQPELNQTLDSFGLRQLKQRIGLRCHLEPLSADETTHYIHRRLELAGANSLAATIFSDSTAAAIFRHSGGIPRLINTICENALILGYAKQTRPITSDIIEEVAGDLRLGVVSMPNGNEIGTKDNKVPLAGKTLMELHEYLQSCRAPKTKPSAVDVRGVKDDGPYI